MSNVAIKWTGDDSKLFIGRDTFGHVVVCGSWPNEGSGEQEWRSLKPSDLLLLSLGSCSAYDVVTIMNRQRQKLTGLFIEVKGKQLEEPPYAFTNIHVHYKVAGDNLDARKVERAIQLSNDRYCSVAATVRGVAELSYSFEIM